MGWHIRKEDEEDVSFGARSPTTLASMDQLFRWTAHGKSLVPEGWMNSAFAG